MQAGICDGAHCADAGIAAGVAEKQEAFFLRAPCSSHKEQDEVYGKGQKEVQRRRIGWEKHHKHDVQQPDCRRYPLGEAGFGEKQRCPDMAQRCEQEENQLSKGIHHIVPPPRQLKWLKKAFRSGITVPRGSGSSAPVFSTAVEAVTFVT